ncbi:MAG: HDIG domain-containing protein [Candidatus Syntrophosphaera sp.]|nr:HDIG domain-containing protein [Candidatus Syntrophosphaera sp.]
MNSKYLLISIIVTICAVGLFQLTGAGRLNYPEYKVSAGQIADFDVVAPFDFPIMKSEEQVQQEYQAELARLGRPHKLDPDVEFAAYSNLDKLFELLYEAASSDDEEALEITARQLGFQLESASLAQIGNPARIRTAYANIRNNLSYAYNVGIYANANSDSILVLDSGGLEKRNAARYFQPEQVLRLVVSRVDAVLARIVAANANTLIKPNLLVDEKAYEELKGEVLEAIDTTSGIVEQNEVVIRKNQRLSEEDIRKLNSLTREYKARGESKSPLMQLLGLLGLLLYVFLTVISFNYNLSQTASEDIRRDHSIIMLNLGFVLLAVMAVVNSQLLGLDIFHIPFAMLIISSAILVGFDFAVYYSVCGTLLLGPFVNWDVYGMAVLLLAALLTLALIRRFRSKHEFLRIWFFQFISVNLISNAFNLYSYTGESLGDKIGGAVRNAGYSLVSTTIAVLGCLAIVTFFERKWNRATKQVLLELLDFNHPLLKKLATNAAGTYHHSLIVGNLAERAAEAIGANPLLARVGSYYHDVGKAANPEIFTENNEDSSLVHDKYSPEESADFIRDHVKQGIVLAGKYHIPQAVIDIIVQHHGTSSIRYFLEAAQRNGGVADATDFSYPGPLPRSKEAALVMIADIVESTTKAKEDISDQEIHKIIEDTVQRLIREGQFDEAPITLKELAVAKQVMYPVLESIYRKRIDYPEEKQP